MSPTRTKTTKKKAATERKSVRKAPRKSSPSKAATETTRARATTKRTASRRSPSKSSRGESAKTISARSTTSKREVQRDEPAINETELVLTWFRLLARCRGAWLQHLWMNEASIDGRSAVTHAELAGILADQDSLEAEREWSSSQEPVSLWRKEAGEIKRALESNDASRYARLARIFRLTPVELDLLRLASAVAFDPSLGRVCAYLQDHSGQTYLTEELGSRLLSIDRAGIWTPEMNVFRWDLIQRHETATGEPTALICDPQIANWLLGRRTLDEALIGAARLVEASGSALSEWPVEEIATWIRESLEKAEPQSLRVIVVAPRGGGKRDFAAAVGQYLGLPLLIVDADQIDESNWQRVFLHAQRQVFLDPTVLAWAGESSSRRSWPTGQLLFPIQFVLCEPGAEPAPFNSTVDRRVVLPMPAAATRERLWRESSAEAKRWPEDELRRLASHHTVWPGDISLAAKLGATTPSEASLLVRSAARSRFGNLAQILDCSFTPDDLVLPEAVKQLLESISFEAEDRADFWQQKEAARLCPLGQGLIALFSGPTGTGKTMAAQVIAARLSQDLCRVNVAQLVSKWVGETPKNVEQVIRVAAENNVVLFFDEADALFARRSTEIRDAQDKFANTDTAFLLQAIESYPGIAILATNLKSNIDSAFVRRIRYIVEFPKPDAKLQLVLWNKLVTALAGEQRAKALAPVCELLSASTEATGAQIKFGLLAALFAARADGLPLNARHLLLGMDRELAKEGRAIGPRERDKILKLEEQAA
jgi:ATPase family associated with various cellular activities (AAA)